MKTTRPPGVMARQAIRNDEHQTVSARPPAHLGEHGRKLWLQVRKDYPELKKSDEASLGMLCSAYDRHEKCAVTLAEQGLTYGDANGVMRARPEISIQDAAARTGNMALTKLGLSRASRDGLSRKSDRPVKKTKATIHGIRLAQ